MLFGNPGQTFQKRGTRPLKIGLQDTLIILAEWMVYICNLQIQKVLQFLSSHILKELV